MKLSNNMKTALAGILIVIVIAIFYFTYPWNGNSSEFKKGNEINYDTFKDIMNNADNIYIVMDVRDASGSVKTNILQCGVDFAGSYALVNRNVTYMSLDSVEKCMVGNAEGSTGVYEINECLGMLNNGVSLYIIEGDGTEYYSKAAMIGVNESYSVGMCSVGGASLSNY